MVQAGNRKTAGPRVRVILPRRDKAASRLLASAVLKLHGAFPPLPIKRRKAKPAPVASTTVAKVKVAGFSYRVTRIPDASAERQLTPLQGVIVQLVGQGLPDKRIAEKLDMSLSTLQTHMRRLFRRWQVHSRAALLGRVMVLS